MKARRTQGTKEMGKPHWHLFFRTGSDHFLSVQYILKNKFIHTQKEHWNINIVRRLFVKCALTRVMQSEMSLFGIEKPLQLIRAYMR